MGVTRWEGPVEAGTHQVTVKKDGYYTRVLDLDVTRGQKRAVTAQLDEKQSISWVVWGLGALAVVADGSTVAVNGYVRVVAGIVVVDKGEDESP